MKIPEPYVSMTMDCGECRFKSTPDMVEGHLIESHGYRVGEAESVLKDWIDSFVKDAEGWPLEECLSHGFYRYGSPCYGCEAVDRSIDHWKETRYARR